MRNKFHNDIPYILKNLYFDNIVNNQSDECTSYSYYIFPDS